MNQMKDYFSVRYPELHCEDAFAWHKSNLPALDKKKSVAFLLAVSVAVIGAVSAGAFIIYLGLFLGGSFENLGLLAATFVVGVLFFIAQMYFYHSWLKD